MDFDDITFTEWQIDKVRVALGKYRIANASNGRLTSWSRVRDDITNSDVNIDRYFEDDAELAFKPEALRRFAIRASVLELEKLEDVTRFLLHEGILTLEDMDESDMGLKKMLAAHEYLSTKSDRAKYFLTSMEGIYTAQREFDEFGYNYWETFTLRIIPDPSKEFVRVEEIYENSSQDLSAYRTLKERNRFTNLRVAQIGYGFSVASDDFLHVFLNGAEPGVGNAYVQADFAEFSHLSDKTIVASIYLVRHGHRHLNGLRRQTLPDGAVHLYNGLQFVPAVLPT
ncbi:hypothetical protein [Pseudomonas mohnii]